MERWVVDGVVEGMADGEEMAGRHLRAPEKSRTCGVAAVNSSSAIRCLTLVAA